jgi:DNA-directed RNA polymerase specialized sigma24 family protein
MSPGDPNAPRRGESTDSLTIRAAGDSQSANHRIALEQLLISYQPVLKAHLVIKKGVGPELAEDLVQSFIQERILAKKLVASFDPAKGKFRTFLLTSFDRFFIDSWRRAARENRDAELISAPTSETGANPDVFDVAWAMQVLGESVRRMHDECVRKDRLELWGIFEGRTLAPLRGISPISYQLLAQRHGLDSGKQAANRYPSAEAMFRRNFCQVIEEYANTDLEGEIQDFREIFARAGAELVENLRIQLWNLLPEITMSTLDPERIDPRLLAELLHLPATPDEPGATLRHLLAAPVPLDLSALTATSAGKIRSWADAQGLLLKSVGDLFTHPHPLVELLELVKDFAKEHRTDPESPMPRAVATALYYASIAVALVRCGQRITRHDDATLLQGFQWGIDQPWVDEPVRNLLREGLARVLGAKEPKA